MDLKKIASIRAELDQMEGIGWYTKYAITQELIKEAGWKENITSGILAALFLVLTGTTVEAASRKTNTKKNQILEALGDADTVNKAIEIYKLPVQKKPVNKVVGKPKMNPTPNPLVPSKDIKTPTSMPSFDDLYSFIKSNENSKNKVYRDPAGNLAIGLGFNLDRSLAVSLFKNMGINLAKVKSGQRILSEKEIKQLFSYDLQLATNNAKLFVNNFDYLPTNVKMVLIDMSYNMGLPRLSSFHNFKDALEKYDYQRASEEMKDSKWYTQVKGRGVKLVNMVANTPSKINDSPTQLASL